MKGRELKEFINKLHDEAEYKFYIWDYEYDEENPSEIGIGKIINITEGLLFNYINIGVNR